MVFKRIYWILGAIFPIFAYSCILTSVSLAPWFSWYNNALSDLGIYPDTAWIFNGGLIISGLLYLIFSINLIRDSKDAHSFLAGIFLTLDAICLSLVGLFPENFGHIHTLFAILYFLIFPPAFILMIPHFLATREPLFIIMLFLLGALLGLSIWFIPWRELGIRGLAIPELIGSLANSIPIAAYSLYKFFKK